MNHFPEWMERAALTVFVIALLLLLFTVGLWIAPRVAHALT